MMNQIFAISSYYFNPYAIPTLFMSVFMLTLGVYVFKQNMKSIVNFAFLLLCMSLLSWLAGFTMTYLSRDEKLAIFWYSYFSFLGVTFISPNVYFFTVSLLNLLKKQKWLVLVSYLAAILFYMLMIKTDYFVIGAKKYFWGWYPLYGPISYPFLAFFFVLMLISFRNYVASLRKIDAGIEKKRIKYVFIGLLLAYIGSVDYIATYGIEVYPFGYIPICIFGLFITYTTLKYRLVVITPALAADTIIETMSEALLVVNQEGVVQFLNQVARELFGYSEQELLGKPITTVIRDPLFLEQLKKVLRTGRVRDYDIVHHSKQGNTYALSLSATAIQNKSAKPTAIVCILKDITERKKMEEELKRVKQQIEFILGATKTGLDIIDSEFNLVYIDPEWQRVYGEPTGKKCYEYFAGQKAICPGCGIPKALETKKTVISEERLPKEGNRPIQVTTIPFQDKSGNWLVAEVNVDITERKQVEMELKNAYNQLKEAQVQLIQSAKMAAVGQLGAGVAHELNNPLGGILGYAQFVLEKLKKPELSPDDFSSFTRYMESIEREGIRCKKIVESLLRFSKRPVYVKPGPLDMKEILEETFSIIGHQLKLKNVNVLTDIKLGLAKVLGITNQLQQVFTNLILNAQQAMPEGGELKITCENIQDESTHTPKAVKIEFADTGCGIPEGNLKHMFEPFFTTKQSQKGIGLGLAVSYQIISDHKGTMEVKSKVGKGTTVVITLPVI